MIDPEMRSSESHAGQLSATGAVRPGIIVWSPEASDYPDVHACLINISSPEVRKNLTAIAEEYGLPTLNFVAGERDKSSASGGMVIRLCLPHSRLQDDYHNKMAAISNRVQQAIHSPVDVLVVSERQLGIPTNNRESSRLKFYQYGNPPKPLEIIFDSRVRQLGLA
jgi:hypothetical protein